ncbi:MAG: MlaE family lipid ABC transporter permease subunit [Neisseriaceae bacterium]|nr:MAG: MlaE family lipid ABC transporter permease subunit [Neisseriaceae bacterium]
MFGTIRAIGRQVIQFNIQIGQIVLLLFSVLFQSVKNLLKPTLVIKEIYVFGCSSISIIVFCGLFLGLVLGLQAYNSLILFNAESSLGALVGISVLREIGPVLAAILFASSAGSAMTSEIGLMKSTDQLSALEVMGVNPIERVIGPRFLAGIISVPLLTLVYNAFAILGTYLMAVVLYGLDRNIFWGQMQSAISVSYDLSGSIIKSLVFGILISLIAVYNGLYACPTPNGILKATNHTVVWCSLYILVTDFILTVFLFTG